MFSGRFGILLVVCLEAAGLDAQPLTVEQVFALRRSGESDEAIALRILEADPPLELTAADVKALRRDGASEVILWAAGWADTRLSPRLVGFLARERIFPVPEIVRMVRENGGAGLMTAEGWAVLRENRIPRRVCDALFGYFSKDDLISRIQSLGQGKDDAPALTKALGNPFYLAEMSAAELTGLEEKGLSKAAIASLSRQSASIRASELLLFLGKSAVIRTQDGRVHLGLFEGVEEKGTFRLRGIQGESVEGNILDVARSDELVGSQVAVGLVPSGPSGRSTGRAPGEGPPEPEGTGLLPKTRRVDLFGIVLGLQQGGEILLQTPRGRRSVQVQALAFLEPTDEDDHPYFPFETRSARTYLVRKSTVGAGAEKKSAEAPEGPPPAGMDDMGTGVGAEPAFRSAIQGGIDRSTGLFFLDPGSPADVRHFACLMGDLHEVESGLVALPRSPQPDESWDGPTGRSRVVASGVPLEIQGNTYPDCLVVEAKAAGGTSRTTYARGVGIIRRERSTPGERVTWELVSAEKVEPEGCPYFPLALGQEWVYSWTAFRDGREGSSLLSLMVVGEDPESKTFTMVQSENILADVPLIEVTVSREGVRTSGEGLIIKLPIDGKTRWVEGDPESGLELDCRYGRIGFTKTVPAGTFSNCVEVLIRGKQGPARVVGFDVYAEDVGLIHRARDIQWREHGLQNLVHQELRLVRR